MFAGFLSLPAYSQTSHAIEANELGNSTNQIGFAGKPFDDQTGLSYKGARYYNPVIGRFMGVDPLGFQENNIHSFNRYAYANNNPYKFVDPDGRSPLLAAIPIGLGALVIGGGYYALAPPDKQRDMLTSIGRLSRAIKNAMHAESAESGDKANPNSSGSEKQNRPTGIVGDQSDPKAGPNDKGGKWTSGPLKPENGGTGDFDKDLQHLTGGTRPSQPGDKAPPGSLIGPNGIFGRNPNNGGGKSIDIPANGNKPHETLHYP